MAGGAIPAIKTAKIAKKKQVEVSRNFDDYEFAIDELDSSGVPTEEKL
jgi:hypothetical protein